MVVAIIDCLVLPQPARQHPSGGTWDYMVVVIRDRQPAKIATGAAANNRRAQDSDGGLLHGVRDQYPVFLRTGCYMARPAWAARPSPTISPGQNHERAGIKMKFGVGGIAGPMCKLFE